MNDDPDDIMMLAFKDGRCVGEAWKETGPEGERFNRKIVAAWMKRGFDIRMLGRDDPACKAAHDELWKDIIDRGGLTMHEAQEREANA